MAIMIDNLALTKKYDELVEIAGVCCNVPDLASRITICWNDRFSARMGDARWDVKVGAGRIRLSLHLWPKASSQEQDETVIHEACHIIADFKTGRRQGHSREWREMMRHCGYTQAQRCHTVDCEAIHARRLSMRVEARCGCPSPITVSRVVAARIRGGAKAVCLRCRQHVLL